MERHAVIEIIVREACKYYAIRGRELCDPSKNKFTYKARATTLHLMMNTGLFGSIDGCFSAFKMPGDIRTIKHHERFMKSEEYRRRVQLIKTKIQQNVKSQSIAPA